MPSFRERFWSKVKILGPDDCWEWQASRHPRGYGHVNANGKSAKAHRLAWEFENNSKIPNGMVICHKCDNPPCCNPNHLFIGTQKDNMTDCARKERKRTPITRGIVDEIRKRYLEEDVTQRQLAKEFSVNYKTISEIVKGRSWRWTGEMLDNPKCSPRNKITDSQAQEIQRMYVEKTMKQADLATLFSVDPSVISRIIRGKRHKRSWTQVPGDISRSIKLTDSQVLEIRGLRNSGLTQKEIGEMFGVKPNTISQILSGSKRRQSNENSSL